METSYLKTLELNKIIERAAATITRIITTTITTQGQRACFFLRVFLVCVFIAVFYAALEPPRSSLSPQKQIAGHENTGRFVPLLYYKFVKTGQLHKFFNF